MLNSIILFPFLLLPILHIIAFGIAQQKSQSRHFFKWIQYLNYLNLAISVYAIALLINNTALQLELASWKGLGLSIRIDRLNVVLLTMISIIGLVVSRFSNSYLEGDKRQLKFLGNIAGVIGSIQLFVLSENSLTLFVAWVVTSLFLQKLLTFYPQREKAQLAARKKFILARLGDLTLFCSLSLIYLTFNTGDLSTIFEQLQLTSFSNSGNLQLAAILLVITAILKSAQIPFHGWLIEVMEAPTPVSALLHAGLINAGPYLIIRFSSLIQLSQGAQITLFLVGITTAVYGAFVFIYQPSVKTALGYSSVAHMGFTIMLCGIGAYSAALLHLTAHSFYKAHAFLSSGSEIEKSSGMQLPQTKKKTWNRIIGFLLSMTMCLFLGNLTGMVFGKSSFTLSVIFLFLSLAISAMIAYSFSSSTSYKSFFQITFLSLLSLSSFLILEATSQQLLNSQLAEKTELTGIISYSIIGMLTIFALLIVFHSILPDYLFKNLRQKLTVHLRNGLYINLFINRLMGAYRKQQSK